MSVDMMHSFHTSGFSPERREELILEHLGQVQLIARRIHERLPGHVPLDDLISTGVIGLIAAIDNFDLSRKVQLKTYAEHKIRGAIYDSLRGLDPVSRTVRKKAREIENAIEVCKQRLRREPGEEEIAKELGVPIEEYRRRLIDVQGIDLQELEYSSEEGHGSDLLRFIPDSEDNLPSRLVERSELERLVAETIDKMPKIERTVLSLYYEEELSLKEIAPIVKLHLSRVSQLKAQAVLRIRTYLERRLTLLPAATPANARAESTSVGLSA